MGVPGRAVWAGPLRLLLLAGTGQGAERSGVWSDLSWSHCGPRAEAQGEFLLALTRTPQDRGQPPHPRFSVIQGERASSSSPPPRPTAACRTSHRRAERVPHPPRLAFGKCRIRPGPVTSLA